MSNSMQNELIITLSCRGEDLYTLNSKDFVEEISIGRNSDCTWSVGHVDSATSGRHAMISRRKNTFYLTDLGSRNGIFLNERKVKEVKLAPGMVFHFGECSLSVNDPSAKPRVKVKPCFLRYTDENGKRCKFKISTGNLKIGAGEKCDVVLNSGLVSTPHAALTRKKDGSCWLRDLNSRNGTSVNGRELTGKVERMLKNGDVISVADIDLTFYDGSSERHTLKLAVALLTLVATVLVSVGIYFFWLQFTPSSQEYLFQARSVARDGDFAEARRLVAFASGARKAKATQGERKLFLAQIDTWENSAKRLERLHFLLNTNKFKEIPQLLGTMELEYISAWDWNEKNAVSIKQELELIKKMFTSFSRVEMVFSDSEADVAELGAIEKEIKSLSAQLQNSSKKGVKNLLGFAGVITRKIAAVKGACDSYDKVIRSLQSASDCDIPATIAALEKLQRTYRLPCITGRIEKILPALYSLQSAETQIAKSKKLLNEMRFMESAAVPVAVSDSKVPLAGVEQRVANLKKESEKLKQVAADLHILHGSLVRQNIEPGKNVHTLEAFLNTADMAKVFACDTLQLSPAARSRTQGVGNYDKYVGIEYLYGTLVMFRSNEIVRSRYVIPFESILERAVFHLGLINYFKSYAAGSCRSFLVPGKLNDFIKYLDSQIILRDRIVSDMKRHIAAAKPGSREYFIAHGIAYALNPGNYTFAQREAVSKEFARYRVRLQELNRKYNTVLPDEAVKIRDQVLKEGIPGDAAVKRMWSLR